MTLRIMAATNPRRARADRQPGPTRLVETMPIVLLVRHRGARPWPDRTLRVILKQQAIGMPRWWVDEPYINLHVVDEPLTYTLSSGQEMVFRFIYKQNYKLPQPDQIPTFYNNCVTYSRDDNPVVSVYLHGMQGFAGPPALGSVLEMTNGMTNAAWMHNWQGFIVLWDANWETKFDEGLGVGAPFSDFIYEALAVLPDGGMDYFTSQATNQSLNASTQLNDPVSQVQTGVISL